jgi:glutathione S-transferase
MRAAEKLTVHMPTDGLKDVQRIDAMWQDCRARYASRGPWLFGSYSVADAMYAPVVLRFNTYGANVSSPAHAYIEQTLADAALGEWLAAAQRELVAASK